MPYVWQVKRLPCGNLSQIVCTQIWCSALIPPRKHALDHGGRTAYARRQHELDHTDRTDHTDPTDHTGHGYMPKLEDLL